MKHVFVGEKNENEEKRGEKVQSEAESVLYY
jgi:hypothetical protein